MDLTVETEKRQEHVVVIVTGELDLATAPALRDHLAATLARTDHFVLDLGDVQFMDSTGLQARVATRRRANLSGNRFRLRLRADGPVDRLLALAGLQNAFEVEHTCPD